VTDVAAVDIGGTKIAVARVEESGRLTGAVRVPTPTGGGPEAILQTVARLVGDVGPVAAVGVGSAGVIDPNLGCVRSATDAIPGWAGTRLREELQERLRVPVAVDNDVHAHALGEHRSGLDDDCGCMLFVTVGTGVGGSVVFGGRVHHGRNASAGHLGHLPAPAAGTRRCSCGVVGHVESVASGPAMVDAYRQRGTTPVSDLAEVSARADAGDELAAGVIVEGAVALGSVLGGLVNLLDPDAVVVAGGVTACGERWWRALQKAADAEVLPALSHAPIRETALGADGALLGAAHLAWQALR
jgi:glucokinase